MSLNLVLRYGLMPKKNFAESFSSESSAKMNMILGSKLREYSYIIRNVMAKNPSKDVVQQLIQDQMTEIYRILAICLGVPKDEFVWEYYDKNKVYHKVGPITPVKFYNELVKPVFDMENKV